MLQQPLCRPTLLLVGLGQATRQRTKEEIAVRASLDCLANRQHLNVRISGAQTTGTTKQNSEQRIEL